MKNRPIFIASAIVALAAAIAAAGCGGGASTTPSLSQPATTQQQTAQASLTIVIPPASSASSSSRGTEYVSPSTGSVSFQLPSMTSATVVAVGPGSSGCTGSVGAGYTCTASFTAPLGANQSLTVKTYASTTGTGAVLSQNTVPITVAATGGNAVTVTLNGVATSLALVLNPTGVTVGTGATFTATWSAKDASGNTIIGPGTVTDSTGTAITPALTNNASAPSGFSTGTLTAGAWTVTYTGAAETSPVTFTVTATGGTGVTVGTAALTVTPAATASPSAAPTATATATTAPTASPTAAPTANAITDGDFTVATSPNNALGSPWYTCAYNHTAFSAPINPSPAPSPVAQVATNPTASPFPSPGTTPVAQLETAAGVAGALTTPPPSGDATFAMVESSISVAGAIPKAFKGAVGICQDITIPSGTPNVYVQVYEGGNDSFADTDTEADLFTTPAGAPHSDGVIITTAPLSTLFAEDNCWDSAAQDQIFLASPYGSGSVTASPTGRYANCPETPGTGPTPSGFISLGGFWYSRILPVPAGQTGGAYTLFLGVWRNAGSSAPSSSAAGYYSYAYFSAVGLH